MSASHHDWGPPIAFHVFDAQPFPMEALPGWVRDWVREEAESTQTPPDLAAVVVLAALATATAKKVVVVIKNGWDQPLNLYMVIVLPPANRKSSVFRDAVRPLEQFMRDEAIRLAPEIRDAIIQRRIAAKRLKKAEDAAAKAEDYEQEALEEEAKRLGRDLAAIVVPEPVRLIADDATPERLTSLLAIHGGRIAVLSAEGGLFGLMAGRYSKDGSPNFEVFLKGWDGDDIRVDRVGRPPEHIPKPAVTIGLTVQPSIIYGLMEKAEFRGRGLPARFFYSLPASPVGRREINPRPMSPAVRAHYQRNMLALLSLTEDEDVHGSPQPHPLMFTADARGAFDRFQAELEPRLGEGGDLEAISDWGGKLAGGVARIAGLLHVARHAGVKLPWEAPIDTETVEAAIQIGRYLIPHAKAAFSMMGSDPVVEQAKWILRWIERNDQQPFSLRDAFESLKARFKRVDAMAAPMGLLIQHNYIRQAEPEERSGPGRPPSPEFEVNPLWPSQYSHNPQNPPEEPHSANNANFANDPDADLPSEEDDLAEGAV